MRTSRFVGKIWIGIWMISMLNACRGGTTSENDEIVEENPELSASEGKELYTSCVVCHGDQGQGNQILNAPAIAGQEEWYLVRQLHNFRNGIRGKHEDDTFGKQMAPMALVFSTDLELKTVATYISNLTPVQSSPTVEGEPGRGKTSYNMICQSCHGTGGKGNQALNAPNLLVQDDWYLFRQYNNFQKGIRGEHKDDTYGAQMKLMSNALPAEEDILNILVYLQSIKDE